MKNLKFITLIFIALIYSNLNATVRTVNNNPGAVANYTSLAAAISAASPHDTIYIAGSPYYYDGTNTIRIHKKGLVLIGPGYYLGNNPKTQASNNDASIYQLIIGQGGDSCVIMGLNLRTSGQFTTLSDDLSDGNDGTIGPQGVILRRNIMHGIYLGAGSADNTIAGAIIEQNIITGQTNNLYIYSPNVTNITIQNNIFTYNFSYNMYSYADHQLSNSVIRNNVFSSVLYNINSAEIYNNIFRSGATLTNCDNNDIYNNLFIEVTILTGTSTGNNVQSNLTGQSPSGLFLIDSPSYDTDFQLGATSPAKGIGVDNVDAGAFSGNSYVLSGIPPIPAIYEIKTNGYGTVIDGMNVTIKVKSNL